MKPETWTKFDPAKSIAIIGTGVMGTKVAWACARSRLKTRVYDVDRNTAEASRQRALSFGSEAEADIVSAHLRIFDSLEQAVEGAQLAFENVPEDLELKRRVLGLIGDAVAETAYIGSNTSSLICSPLAEASGKPARFFNMNFTDPRHGRLVELMSCEATAAETVDFAVEWARAIGMIPIRVRKEQMGYSFNRIWRVIKKEVLRQVDQGYSTPEDIDRAWIMSFGTEFGPCGLMDEIGLASVLNVERAYFEDTGDDTDRPPATLVERVERNELGVMSRKGFYDYPDPAYRQPDFLEGATGQSREREDPETLTSSVECENE